MPLADIWKIEPNCFRSTLKNCSRLISFKSRGLEPKTMEKKYSPQLILLSPNERDLFLDRNLLNTLSARVNSSGSLAISHKIHLIHWCSRTKSDNCKHFIKIKYEKTTTKTETEQTNGRIKKKSKSSLELPFDSFENEDIPKWNFHSINYNNKLSCVSVETMETINDALFWRRIFRRTANTLPLHCKFRVSFVSTLWQDECFPRKCTEWIMKDPRVNYGMTRQAKQRNAYEIRQGWDAIARPTTNKLV